MFTPAAIEKLAPLSFGTLDGDLLLSNDAGHWARLSSADTADLFAGTITPGHPRFAALAARGFLREGLDTDALAARIRHRTAPLFQGTNLHILVVTLRCDHACRYCHASRLPLDAAGADMSIDTARQSVDLAFQTRSPNVNIEFQGGEPLANAEVVRFVIEYARECNRFHKKELRFSLVTNLTRMQEAYFEWLVAPDVAVCTSLDGPADLHDANRRLLGGGSAFAAVSGWLRRFREVYAERALDPGLFHVEALMTTTRASLRRAQEIVDTYLALGLPALHLRPLNRYGFAAAAWARIGYTGEEYLRFYFEALNAVIVANAAGGDLREQTAAVYLTKLLTPDDPGHMDLRSPCGAGIGQLAYDIDGKVYTCDEGRMLARTGDATFNVGHVETNRWSDVVSHPTVRAMAAASLLETLPGCRDCVYRPFCGVCPVQSWATDGDLFGHAGRSTRCVIQRGQLEGLLRLLHDDAAGTTERLFKRWTVNRPRVPPPACAT
ncbi:His-Xaa-Ser system radical SAM maturase HxsB [Deltaproteobacteria bacterium]|nr:His-Xaa-Ser system radical SAM maturase HxsB [Deltaproteobacteria bacterium]